MLPPPLTVNVAANGATVPGLRRMSFAVATSETRMRSASVTVALTRLAETRTMRATGPFGLGGLAVVVCPVVVVVVVVRTVVVVAAVVVFVVVVAGFVYLKALAELLCEVPPGVVTRMKTVPTVAGSAGETAVIWVSESTLASVP